MRFTFVFQVSLSCAWLGCGSRAHLAADADASNHVETPGATSAASAVPETAVPATSGTVPAASGTVPALDAGIRLHGAQLDGGVSPQVSATANEATAGEGARTLFWLDVGGKVLTSSLRPFAAKTIVAAAGRGPDGIAVDVANGFIYWTNMGVPADNDGSLMRSNLEGSKAQTLVPAGGVYTPKQLKLDAIGKKLYWSDREGMRVQRANLDGSQIETLYVAAVGDKARKDLANHCVGIAIDREAGYFYWSQKGPDNGRVGSLRRAHLDLPNGDSAEQRSDVEILYDGLAAPIDVELDPAQGLIYWTNRGDDTVNRGPIELPAGFSAKTRNDRQVIVKNVPEAIGIALDLPQNYVYYTDAKGDVGRAHLDGSDAEFLLKDNGAFTGIAVVTLP